MSAEENDIEPKLTVKLRSEITEPEPFGYTVLKPAEPIVEPEDEEESAIDLEPEQTTIEPEDEEETFEATRENVDIPKVQERKPQREKARKSKVRKIPKNESKDKPISKLHDELRKHSDARKKAEREILDIRKELKDLLLVHHATIKDLQKQVAQLHRKIATIDSSKKPTRVKTTAKKITRNKKTSSSIKSKKKSSQKKSRKR
ncbi:MAG: hypothetical protein ACHQ1D_01935 [Nitrososphaerales archaeon]